MLFLKGMSKDQQTLMYRDLYYTSLAINSGKDFLKDLKSIEMAEALTEHVTAEIKDFESTMKSSLYYIDDKDRIAIMSNAFNSLSSIKSQASIEGDNGFYEKQINALNTLIDLNNQTMFVKYGIQSSYQQQESLSLLPQDQLQSFSQFLSTHIANHTEQPDSQDNSSFMRVEPLYNATIQMLGETTAVEQQ